MPRIRPYSSYWPTANKLRQRLRSIASALRSKGVEFIELPRRSKGRLLRLERAQKKLTQSTHIDNSNDFDYDGSKNYKSNPTFSSLNNINYYL